MTKAQIKRAQRVVDNCSFMGAPFEAAVWILGKWMKDNGIRITTKHLDQAFAHLIENETDLTATLH